MSGQLSPKDLDQAYRLAQAVNRAGMAPYGMETAEKVMIALMTGLEVGMPPMMAVQSIAIINKRPCIWGDGLIGIVRSSKECMYVKEWIDGEGDDRIAVCETKRRGEKEPVKRTFSVDDAKRAGLWQDEARVTRRRKDGSSYETDNDSPWYKYPQRMLQMRARAWCLRDVYADIIRGIQVREEVEDHIGADNAIDITPEPEAEPGSTADRLKANKAAQEEREKKEGFDPDHVAKETEEAIEGEIIGPEEGDGPSDGVEGAAADAAGEAAAPSPEPSEGDHSAQCKPEDVGEEERAGVASGEPSSPSQDAAAESHASAGQPEEEEASSIPASGDEEETGEGDAPQSVPSSESPSSGDDIDPRFKTAVRQAFGVTTMTASATEKRFELKQLHEFWKGNLTKENHARLDGLIGSVEAVLNGEQDREIALEYFAGVLECTVEDLE